MERGKLMTNCCKRISSMDELDDERYSRKLDTIRKGFPSDPLCHQEGFFEDEFQFSFQFPDSDWSPRRVLSEGINSFHLEFCMFCSEFQGRRRDHIFWQEFRHPVLIQFQFPSNGFLDFMSFLRDVPVSDSRHCCFVKVGNCLDSKSDCEDKKFGEQEQKWIFLEVADERRVDFTGSRQVMMMMPIMSPFKHDIASIVRLMLHFNIPDWYSDTYSSSWSPISVSFHFTSTSASVLCSPC